MNSLKCVFSVSAEKFIGFVLHKERISIDEQKREAILIMTPPQNKRQLKIFIGKVSYIWRFIPRLVEVTSPIQRLLKNGILFEWDDACYQGFNKIKTILTTP